MPTSPQIRTGDYLRRHEREAIACHARTGIAHCIVQREGATWPAILPETEVVAGGQTLIDAIVWSTDTAETEGLDPALLA
ncbi:hypothetical protein AWL63_18340 [Sphingomonas panacis]|uniref:Uncharacterized protein n=1 Tax=Sphingomonas panacis TaxID=1560345 RepID=A0A1B3ZDU7_9SPHN|nr:hypothetical protein [Sphingomonas panacis]AOH85603.1 hypothetical protein AWL63_18340 [Sphingomonas panacis]